MVIILNHVCFQEFKTLLYKALSLNNPYFFLSLLIEKQNYDQVKLVNRRNCLLTKRNRGHYRNFQLSRNQIRLLGSLALLPRLQKSHV